MKISIKNLNESEISLVAGTGFGDGDVNINPYLVYFSAAICFMACGCGIWGMFFGHPAPLQTNHNVVPDMNDETPTTPLARRRYPIRRYSYDTVTSTSSFSVPPAW